MDNGTYGVWTHGARADASTNPNNQPNKRGSEVGLFGGHFIPLDRTDNSAHAQRAGSALHHPIQQYGFSDHHPDRFHTAYHHAAHAETAQADAGHERAPAEAEGDSRPVFQGPVPRFPGDHAPVPGGRGQPVWLSGPDDRPDACFDRAVPGVDPDRVLQTGRPGWIIRKDVHLDTHRAHLFGGAVECEFPVVGPVSVRPYQHNHAGARLRVHLGPAEDDHATVHGPKAIGQPGDDALADAADDCVLLVHIAQRTGPLLGNIQRDRHSDPILRNWWLGTIVPVVPQSCTGGGSRSKQGIPRCPIGGVVRTWNR